MWWQIHLTTHKWIRIAQQLPWKAWEALYVAIFPSNTGNVAKPCRMVLGSLILQMRLGFTDRELVDQLRQNPYYQYYIGLPFFQHTAPFTRTLLVEWRKRIDLWTKYIIPKTTSGSAMKMYLVFGQQLDFP